MPRSTVNEWIASAMAVSAILSTPSAAAGMSNPEGRRDALDDGAFRGARRPDASASRGSARDRDVRGRGGNRSRSAPLLRTRSRPVPASRPALLGPTRNAPRSSIHAIEPRRHRSRSRRPSAQGRGDPRPRSPSAPAHGPLRGSRRRTWCPPTSVQIASGCPRRRAREATATTPPAGPEDSVRTGRSTARSTVIIPPFDCITPIGASHPDAGQPVPQGIQRGT